jgi:hypothetical protein
MVIRYTDLGPGEMSKSGNTFFLLFGINTNLFHRSYIAVDLELKQVRILSW